MVFRTAALLVLLCIATAAQPSMVDTWRKPFPAHRIIASVHYVGTYDLACYLITTPAGHILINTGLADSVPLIRQGVQDLGFRFEDIKLLLTMQAHFDHVAGMAEVQKLTGARMLATEGDAPLLADGGKSDYHLGREYWFAPVTVHRKLRDGEMIKLGNTELTVHVTPGHTQGSSSYGMSVTENGRTYRVLFANMGSINPGVKLTGNAKYPQIAADYARAFDVQKKLPCDVFLSAHASQYGLHEKFKPGQAYRAEAFVDPDGYRKAVASYEQTYREQLAREQGEKRQQGKD